MWAVILPPILGFIALSALSLLLRRALLPAGESPIASGAIVMTVGIFALDSLQRMPIGDLRVVTRAIALELLVIWIIIAASYVRSWSWGEVRRRTMHPVNRFAVGTWVAGTAVLGVIILVALPAWRPLAETFWLVSIVLWGWFLTLAATGFRTIASDPTREHARGRILLSTVSTQSVVILAVALLPGQIPRGMSAGAIALGGLFYLVGAVLIAARYLGQRGWRVTEDWDNTNCILHGAVSITGLAAISSDVLTGRWLVALWLWAAAMFLVVECIELIRAVFRVREYGWKRGLLTYHVSQWARTFTFGMFYAFTLHLRLAEPQASIVPVLAALRGTIVTYGQYGVLLFVLVEVALFIRGNLHFPTSGALSSSRFAPFGASPLATFGGEEELSGQ
jgi:hypothetical protein